jgi:hypothetical protein
MYVVAVLWLCFCLLLVRSTIKVQSVRVHGYGTDFCDPGWEGWLAKGPK